MGRDRLGRWGYTSRQMCCGRPAAETAQPDTPALSAGRAHSNLPDRGAGVDYRGRSARRLIRLVESSLPRQVRSSADFASDEPVKCQAAHRTAGEHRPQGRSVSPRIGLSLDPPIRMPDQPAPRPGSVARWKRLRSDFLDTIRPCLQAPHDRKCTVDTIRVADGIAAVYDSKHGSLTRVESTEAV
jgi:hypothetical protein